MPSSCCVGCPKNQSVEAERLILLAPYKDYDDKYDGFSDYQLDSGLIARVGRISILHSDDDHKLLQWC